VIIDPVEFRAVLGHFASGVLVVAALDSGQPAGFTCQSFFSLSLEPPLIALAPGKASTSWPRVALADGFCANVLADDQEVVARTFARSGPDKFAGVNWSAGDTGHPHLSGCLAWIDCVIETVHDAGDHHLVIGRVVGLEAGAGRPLLFYRGGFRGVDG
jgi:flavin reductase (DIM6/NTAB) family NADH-FMN oxidoreductase RutF